MTPAPKLTLEACRALQPGQVLRDHVVRGLQLRGTANGKTWMLYYRANGKQRRPAIGYFPALTIELARDAARALLAAVARGDDPSRERRERRHAPTVADLADAYLAFKDKINKPRTQEEMRRHVRYIKEAIGTRKVADATATDIEAVLQFVTERRGSMARRKDGQLVGREEAPFAANRVRETLRGMFSYAERPSVALRRYGSNPVRETRAARTVKRKVLLEPKYLPAVIAALQDAEAAEPVAVTALWCIMFAGTRVTEMLSADRSDWRDSTVTLREHKTDRTGADRVIYLPRQAVEKLQRLPVFPNGKLFGGLDRFGVFRVWERVRVAAGCPAVTVRDFRRTFISTALTQGFKLDQIGELMSHGSTETTKGYAWLLDSGAAGIAQATADAILDAATAKTE